ncbi:unnamed protein product [Acanthoscelides obtectus]|uniref:Uncharacterized protein n=1 Tax=Acanthoscelides obtectus TaxID=200917 RepID=A0A9P0L9M4_ACAOB|nr:unnamed protein product [Acanthoscelides obtectus]CAK1624103.1 hypothetical protein AOBTE_LOCUS2326 [Acanthoscelides obtectus]
MRYKIQYIKTVLQTPHGQSGFHNISQEMIDTKVVERQPSIFDKLQGNSLLSGPMQLRVGQSNLQHSNGATAELMATFAGRTNEIILIQKPYCYKQRIPELEAVTFSLVSGQEASPTAVILTEMSVSNHRLNYIDIGQRLETISHTALLVPPANGQKKWYDEHQYSTGCIQQHSMDSKDNFKARKVSRPTIVTKRSTMERKFIKNHIPVFLMIIINQSLVILLAEKHVHPLDVKKKHGQAEKSTNDKREQEKREKVEQRVRKYREALKSNLERYEEAKRLERERYQRRKEQGKIKSINDLTPRQQRKLRKDWRARSKKVTTSYDRNPCREMWRVWEQCGRTRCVRILCKPLRTKIFRRRQHQQY